MGVHHHHEDASSNNNNSSLSLQLVLGLSLNNSCSPEQTITITPSPSSHKFIDDDYDDYEPSLTLGLYGWSNNNKNNYIIHHHEEVKIELPRTTIMDTNNDNDDKVVYSEENLLDLPESQNSPNSTVVSSFSSGGGRVAVAVKRERDLSSEEVEATEMTMTTTMTMIEMVSSRVSDEDEDGTTVRKKLRLNKDQSAMLEDSFKQHTTLNPKQKQALARQLNLLPRQVEVWFQNRRARTKVKQTEVDYEFLKKCCETLRDENRRLQKELQELKTLKLSHQPLYMTMPAATLTMCPSCERLNGVNNSGSASNKNPFSTLAPNSHHHFFNPFTNHIYTESD